MVAHRLRASAVSRLSITRGLSLALLIALSLTAHAGGRRHTDPPGSAYAAVGARPERGYFSSQPWERVDVVNGNLTLMYTDLVLPGNAGMDLRITRTYRHQSEANAWSLSFVGVPTAALLPAAPDAPSLGPTGWLHQAPAHRRRHRGLGHV